MPCAEQRGKKILTEKYGGRSFFDGSERPISTLGYGF